VYAHFNFMQILSESISLLNIHRNTVNHLIAWATAFFIF
jgi:hypothetical protein